jgi:tRNA pseudouridine55 synthase
MSKRNKGRDLNGILIVDKPQGLTSNGVVSRLKRWSQAKKVGHTGALDPMATGVLPIVFGEATKFSQYGLDAHKGYLARIQLGSATDTLDADGNVVLVKPIP